MITSEQVHDLTEKQALDLQIRLHQIDHELHNQYRDLRCGCVEDGTGRSCNWDDGDAIELELIARGEIVRY